MLMIAKRYRLAIIASGACFVSLIAYTGIKRYYPSRKMAEIVATRSPSLFLYEKTNPKSEYFVPIVYNPEYDIKFWSLLNVLHSFDIQKWGKIHKLISEKVLSGNNITTVTPKRTVVRSELLLIHTERFLESIERSSVNIARVAEVWPLGWLPVSLLQTRLLEPFKWQTAGSVLAAKMALDRGWAINLGGGFHHASATNAEGFCFYADISLIMRYLWDYVDNKLKIMVIDLDAHQGNGYEKVILNHGPSTRRNVYVVDVYNPDIFPGDEMSKNAINKRVEIHAIDAIDDNYMKLIDKNIDEALDEFTPNLIIYNAGTDILEGDKLGRFHITPKGVIERDRHVFKAAIDRKVPIVMLTSGGYQANNALVIANSIQNLFTEKIIDAFDEQFVVRSAGQTETVVKNVKKKKKFELKKKRNVSDELNVNNTKSKI